MEEAQPVVQGVVRGNEGLDKRLIAAAHELKNPLALVRQLTLGLLDEGALTTEQRRQCQQIILTSERGLRLMNDVVRTSRLEDSLFAETEPVNVYHVCEEVAHELMPLYRAQQRELHVAAASRPVVVANRELLRRVLVNFTDNALKYGGDEQPVRLTISHHLTQSRVRVAVRDFGPSISKTAWRHLRQQLGTAPQPLPARPESSGLGLLLAEMSARAMQGKIGATRHRDGMSFFVDMASSTQLNLFGAN